MITNRLFVLKDNATGRYFNKKPMWSKRYKNIDTSIDGIYWRNNLYQAQIFRTIGAAKLK